MPVAARDAGGDVPLAAGVEAAHGPAWRGWVILAVPAAAISRAPARDRRACAPQEADLHGARALDDEDHQQDKGADAGSSPRAAR